MVYSYGRSFNGFAAMLSEEEAAKFSGEFVNLSLRIVKQDKYIQACSLFFPKLKIDLLSVDMEEVVSVFPNQGLELQTTRSWDFVGFTGSSLTPSFDGRNIIIGTLDSGQYK